MALHSCEKQAKMMHIRSPSCLSQRERLGCTTMFFSFLVDCPDFLLRTVKELGGAPYRDLH